MWLEKTITTDGGPWSPVVPIVPHEITDEWADQTRTHWREVIAGGGDHLKILMDDETLFIGLNTGKAKDWNPDETLIKILVKRW